MHTTTDYWNLFQQQNPEFKNLPEPSSFYYGDNKKVADECAGLVINKIKQATSPSMWWFEKNNEPLPQAGDLAIVTDWDGNPKAIVKTIRIEIVRFKDISPEYARIEGEGDGSLAYWKKEHWNYYANEMKAFGEYPTEEMEIVCEYFETIG